MWQSQVHIEIEDYSQSILTTFFIFEALLLWSAGILELQIWFRDTTITLE
jgi:hypothetical protein